LFGVILFAPGPITDKGGEEAGKPVSLVRAGGFKMTSKWLGAYIDAEDRLRMRAHRNLILGGNLCS
jgi:hypothetical protein